jgi:hypothetical protein
MATDTALGVIMISASPRIAIRSFSLLFSLNDWLIVLREGLIVPLAEIPLVVRHSHHMRMPEWVLALDIDLPGPVSPPGDALVY